MMKLFGAASTECLNIMLLCNQISVMDCVLNFIALGIISQIDNIYLASLRDFKLIKAFDKELQISRDKTWKQRDRSYWMRFCKFIHRVCKTIYVSFYYYFMMFVTIAITVFLC